MLSWLATALLLVLALHTVESLHYVYDETLWTKSQWDSFKLDNPLKQFNPSSGLKPDRFQQLLSEHTYNSIDGVLPRRQNSMVTDILATEQPAPEAFNDPKLLEQASQAVQCTTCHALMTTTWERLTSLVNTGKDVATDDIRQQFMQACTQEVADEVLTSSTIYKLQAEAGGATLAFFVVRSRRKGTPRTPLEATAVLSACQTLVDERLDSLGEALSSMLQKYREQLQVIIEGGGQRSGGDSLTGSHQSPGGADGETGDGIGDVGKVAPVSRGVMEGAASKVNAEVAVDGRAAEGAVGGNIKNRGSMAKSDAEDEYDDYGDYEDDEQGAGHRSTSGGDGECRDLHPNCEMWSGLGECELNPVYMVGDAERPGHCLLSCGVCTPRDPQRTRLPPAIISNSLARKDLASVSSSLLDSLKAIGCVAARACMGGGSTTSFSGGVFRASEDGGMAGEAVGAEGGEAEAQGQGGLKVAASKRRWRDGEGEAGGFERGKERIERKQEEAEMQPTGFVLGRAFSGVANYRGLAPAEKAALVPYSLPPPDAPQLLTRVHKKLLKELGNKVLYRAGPPDEFFTYEVVWKQHVQHWHADADGRVTESWSLGVFSGESVDAEVAQGAPGKRVLEKKDLLARKKMEGRVWPYITQMYTGGDRCQQGREEMRQTEVRLVCSPDGEMHMLVREPAFCAYVVVLYLPSLCTLPELVPQDAAIDSV